MQIRDLSHNEFDGALPAEFGELPSLQYLYLRANEFDGEIPPDLSNLERLKEL